MNNEKTVLQIEQEIVNTIRDVFVSLFAVFYGFLATVIGTTSNFLTSILLMFTPNTESWQIFCTNTVTISGAISSILGCVYLIVKIITTLIDNKKKK